MSKLEIEYVLELTSGEAAVICEAFKEFKAPHDISKYCFRDTFIGSVKSLDKKIRRIRKDFVIPTRKRVNRPRIAP